MLIVCLWSGTAQSVYRHPTAWMVGASNPSRSEIFCTHPDRPWNPHNPLDNGYLVSFLGAQRPGLGVNHPPHPAQRSKKKYSYTSTAPVSLHDLF